MKKTQSFFNPHTAGNTWVPTVHSGYWALVLKHRATNIHSADQISIALDQIQTKQYIYRKRAFEDRIKFWKKKTQFFKG